MSMFYRILRPGGQVIEEKPSVSILVFKTDIRSIPDINRLDGVISGLQGLVRWNVDRDDIDNVLRIETTQPDIARVIGLVREAGFFCEELPD